MQYALVLSALTGAVMAASTLAGAPVHEFSCSTPGRTYEQSLAAKHMGIAEAAAVSAGNIQARAPISVKAYIHIVGSSQAKVDAISVSYFFLPSIYVYRC